MMNRTLVAAVIGLTSLFSGVAAQAAGPQNTAAAVLAGQRVLVIPFTTLNVPDNQLWISKGVVESIVADLGRSGVANGAPVTPIAFQGQLVVEDNATAVRLARQASTNLVIRGAAQFVGVNVRLTAQLIDARSGDTVSTASVTGPADDLLKMEDDLSAQLRGSPTSPITGPAPAAANTNPAPLPPAGYAPTYAPQPAQPQIIVISQPAPAPPDYNAYAAYPIAYPGLYGYPYVTPYFTTLFYGNNRNCFPICSPINFSGGAHIQGGFGGGPGVSPIGRGRTNFISTHR